MGPGHPDERGAPNFGIIRLLTQMDLMRSADRNFCSTPTSGNINGFRIFILCATSGHYGCAERRHAQVSRKTLSCYPAPAFSANAASLLSLLFEISQVG